MNQVYLLRAKTSNQGTFGKLITDDLKFACFTGELPWRDNHKNISCIPAGEYLCEIYHSNHFGVVYHVKAVYNRSYILIHSGNWCGNKDKGYKTDTYGCILLGTNYGTLAGQEAVLNSRVAVNQFMDYMKFKKFKLNIIDLTGGK